MASPERDSRVSSPEDATGSLSRRSRAAAKAGHGKHGVRGSGGPSNDHVPDPEDVIDPAANALERIWNDEWERHIVNAALEKVQQQCSAKHYQIFYLQAIKQVPPAKIAATLNVNVDQVYLIKHRLTKIFEEALKELETKLG